jgi:FkbM family methyltransferase
MLIPFSTLLKDYSIDTTKSILHIGAHTLEEREAYIQAGFTDDRIYWIEGNTGVVDQMRNTIPSAQIYLGIISDQDDQEVDFIITNNIQSSSILELEEHLIEHPSVYECTREKRKTITIDTLVEKEQIPIETIEFVNIDIQGAELLALQGMKKLLPYVSYLYVEVNVKHLYKNCGLIHELDTFLEEYHFKRCETVFTKHGWGDAFYYKTTFM